MSHWFRLEHNTFESWKHLLSSVVGLPTVYFYMLPWFGPFVTVYKCNLYTLDYKDILYVFLYPFYRCLRILRRLYRLEY